MSSVVLPIADWLRGSDDELLVRFRLAAAESASVQAWSGVLEFPSGRVMVSDSLMKPGRVCEVTPGRYLVDVGLPQDDGSVTVGLVAVR